MFTHRHLKLAFLCTFLLAAAIWLIGGPVSTSTGTSAEGDQVAPLISGSQDDRYVGSDTCTACHEDQAKKVAGTKHGKLHTLTSWKGKVVGCESCHGPGKEHVESSGDKTKIVSFKRLDEKAASDTCLACHAGKEQHNNFRRGDHWRNNVGCMQCHAGHGPEPGNIKPGSSTLTADVAAQKPGQATRGMLRSNEPQLCIGCHTEVKAQFSKPFRHRVLEGAMNCSDCHNPHGGFEARQTKLAVGVDSACIKCHSNKQGPFVFEHAPLKLEGCSSCHTPHGASNPKMLKRNSVRQLCMECHSSITDQLAPDTPSFHNQAVLRYQNCTTCHSAIHGSNSSSVFFR